MGGTLVVDEENHTTERDRRGRGLRWNHALEAGGVLVGNSVRLELDAQAVKQEEACEEV